MKERRQITIGIHSDKYNILSQKKGALEETLKRNVDWGTYFLMIASQRSLDEAVAVLHDSEDEEADPEDYEEIPPWVTKEDIEEVVNKAADKIISEFKKHLASSTEGSAEKGHEKL